MSWTHLFRPWRGATTTKRRGNRGKSIVPRNRTGCGLELLEDRTLLSVSALSLADPTLYSDTAAGNVQGPASVSKDGRYLVYTSTAANQAAGQAMDSKSVSNVFLYDRSTGATTLVSHRAQAGNSDSTYLADTAHGTSENAVISADGKWVAYVSNSDNLISGATLADDRYYLALGWPLSGTFTLTYSGQTTSTIAYNASASAVQGELEKIVGTGNVGVTGFGGTAGVYTITFTGTLGHGAAAELSADGSAMPQSSSVAATPFALGGGHNEFLCDQYAVYLYSVADGTTTLVSHDASDQETGYQSVVGGGTSGLLTGNGYSFGTSVGAVATAATSVSISGDGRYVAYLSTATHLVKGETDNNSTDLIGKGFYVGANVFVYDRTGDSNHTGDSNYLVSHKYGSTTNADGAAVDPGNYSSYVAVISQDGSAIAFSGEAGNLSQGEHVSTSDGIDTVGIQYFVANRSSTSGWADATTSLVSHNTRGPTYESVTNSNGDAIIDTPPPAITPDGKYIAYMSDNSIVMVASSLTSPAGDNYYLYNNDASSSAYQSNTLVSHVPGSTTQSGSDYTDTSLTTTLPPPAISDDGRYVAFYSQSTDLTSTATSSGYNAFVFDRDASDSSHNVTKITQKSIATSTVSTSDGYPALTLTISGDGQYVAYLGLASADVAGVTNNNGTTGLDALLYDQGSSTPTHTLLSHVDDTTKASTGNASARMPVVSENGATVLYLDEASNLVPGTGIDLNASAPHDGVDLFAYSLTTPSGYTAQASNGSNAAVTLRDPNLPSKTGNGDSEISPSHAVSDDGRFVVFMSSAPNLVASESDKDLTINVYLRDTQSNTTKLLSHSTASATTTGNGASSNAVISGDGKTIVFYSFATNLDTNPATTVTSGTIQLYLYDNDSSSSTYGKLKLITHTSSSTTTGGNGKTPISTSSSLFYVRNVTNLAAGTVTPTDLALPGITADGQYIAFLSNASNIVSGFSGTARTNVYVYDRANDAMTLVSHASTSSTTSPNANSSAVSISADGTTVAFLTKATNLLTTTTGSTSKDELYVWSRTTDSTTGLSAGQIRLASHTSSSTTTAATVTPTLALGALPPSISKDGSFVAYYLGGTNLVANQAGTASATNVFRYDVYNNSNTLVSHADGSASTAGDNPTNANEFEATGPAISGDGRYVAYANNSTNLLSTTSPLTGQNGRDNVYLYDATNQTTTLVSHADASATTPDTAGGTAASLSADGRYVSFLDTALDTTADLECTFLPTVNVRLFDAQASGTTPPATVAAAFDPTTMLNVRNALAPTALSGDGKSVVWDGLAAGVVTGDLNGRLDVFLSASSSQAPSFTSSGSATFTAGTFGTFTVSASGTPAPTFTMTGSLPSGLSFNTTSGVLSGTPGTTTGGTYTFTITASNGVGTAPSQTFTLTINQPAAITTTATTTFTVGTASTFAIAMTGYPAPTLGYTGSLPSGVNLVDNGNGTATLSGTPAANTGGTYTLNLTATNNVGTAATQTFTLVVNQAPAITSVGKTTFTVGTAGTFKVLTTGFPLPKLTVSGSYPSSISFVDNGNGTATLSGTPVTGDGGTYTLTITAANNVGSNYTQSFLLTVVQAPAITSVGKATFTVGTKGTYKVTTTGYPTPAIGTADPLPNGVSLVDNTDGTATLSGTPAAGTGGSYSFTITAGNHVGTDATQTFILTVNQAPAITSDPSATFTVGTLGSFTVLSTGYPAAALSFSDPLPSGLSFVDKGNGTGILSGTPAALTGGSYSFIVTANNKVGTAATQPFKLTISEAPAITSVAKTTFVTGVASSYTITTSGYPLPTITSSGALPHGISFVDNGDGTATLGGKADPGQGGPYKLTISAANGIGTTATQDFVLTLNDAPAITSPAKTTFTVGTKGTFQVTTTGYPVPGVTYSGKLPSGVSLVDNSDGTASLSGTPAAGAGGTYSFVITAGNNVGTAASQTFTLTVNEAPTITSPATTTFVTGVVSSFTVTTGGFPLPSLTSSGSLPHGISFVDNGDGTATLGGKADPGTGGTYHLIISAVNSVGSAPTQDFVLTVNDAPAITSVAKTTFTVGMKGTYTVTTTGYPAPAISTNTKLPSGVSLVDNGDGSATLSGTPADATGGTYSLTLTASNNIGTAATQPFVLTINQAPAITSVAKTTFTVGAAGSYTVTTTGFPKPSLLTKDPLPGGLSFVDNSDGTATLSGTPSASTGGTYSFTISASNGVGNPATQAFLLTIDQAPAITSDPKATFTAGSQGTFTVTATGYPGLTLSATGNWPSGVGFVDNGNGTATISGVPGATTGGSYGIVIKASNGVGTPATQNFTLTVNQAPAITNVAKTTFTVGSTGSYTITSSGYPTAALTESGSLPSGVTFVDNGDGTAKLAGKPAATTGGVYHLTISAANSVGSAATQDFALTVNEAASFTTPGTTTFTVGSFGTFTVGTIGYPKPALTESGTLPKGVGFVDNGDGTATLSGTPAANTGNSYSITFFANNSIGAPANQPFTLKVLQAPAITSVPAALFTVGSPDTFTVQTTGYPNPTLSATGTLPSGLGFKDNGDGTASVGGTPAAGTGGPYTLQITASNGVGSAATQTLTITVAQAPAITSDAKATFTAGLAGTFLVTATGYPQVAIGTSTKLPGGLSLVDHGNGTATLSGTPADGTGGTYHVLLVAANGVDPAATQDLVVTINQFPAITSPATAAFTVGSAGKFTVTATGFPLPGLAETGALPGGLSFVDNGDGTATLAGTPTTGAGGVYKVAVTAANGLLINVAQSLFITVNEAPSITSAKAATFKVDTAGSFTFTTAGFPAAQLFESGALPDGVTFTDNGDGTASLAGTPTDDSVGSYVLTVGASNNVSPDASQLFTLNVALAPSIISPVPLNSAGQLGLLEGQSAKLTSSGTDSALAYSWSVIRAGDPGFTLPTSTPTDTASFTFQALEPGTYLVTLSVTTAKGQSASDSLPVVVTNVAPTVSPVAWATLGVEASGHAAYADSATFTDPGEDGWKVDIDYGDSTVVSYHTTDHFIPLAHTYTESKLFKATVAVSDDSGVAGFSVFYVNVLDAPKLMGGQVTGAGGLQATAAGAQGTAALGKITQPAGVTGGAVLGLASYDGNPATGGDNGPISVTQGDGSQTSATALAFFDVRAGGDKGAVAVATATVSFSFHSADPAKGQMQLFYLNGDTWTAVTGEDHKPPVETVVADPAGGWTHYLTVVFGPDSNPPISAMTGTVFSLVGLPAPTIPVTGSNTGDVTLPTYSQTTTTAPQSNFVINADRPPSDTFLAPQAGASILGAEVGGVGEQEPGMPAAGGDATAPWRWLGTPGRGDAIEPADPQAPGAGQTSDPRQLQPRQEPAAKERIGQTAEKLPGTLTVHATPTGDTTMAESLLVKAPQQRRHWAWRVSVVVVAIGLGRAVQRPARAFSQSRRRPALD
jgi:hypothetical protein